MGKFPKASTLLRERYLKETRLPRADRCQQTLSWPQRLSEPQQQQRQARLPCPGPTCPRRYSQRMPALGQAAVQRDAVAQVDVDLVPADALLLAALLGRAQLQPHRPAQLPQRPRVQGRLVVHRPPQQLRVGGRRLRRGAAGGVEGRRAAPPHEEAEGGQQPQGEQRALAPAAPAPLAPAHPAAEAAGHAERAVAAVSRTRARLRPRQTRRSSQDLPTPRQPPAGSPAPPGSPHGSFAAGSSLLPAPPPASPEGRGAEEPGSGAAAGRRAVPRDREPAPLVPRACRAPAARQPPPRERCPSVSWWLEGSLAPEGSSTPGKAHSSNLLRVHPGDATGGTRAGADPSRGKEGVEAILVLLDHTELGCREEGGKHVPFAVKLQGKGNLVALKLQGPS